jgi:anion-transporting  ArsA/GET3 family ATPase
MLLDDLLRRRLVLLTGKGGVGKSLVGAALALAARARGLTVLLAEIDASREAARYLGASAAGGREAPAMDGLFTINLRPRAVMDEYVRHVTRVGFLADRVLESPIYDRFFAAAPGLKELMVLGKIMVLGEERAPFARRPRFDLVVVDLPATGHGLSLLGVPGAAARAAPVGPIGTGARRILSLLQDPTKTAMVIVAIPEEMAVAEALEFRDKAKAELDLAAAAVVLNGCLEPRFTTEEEGLILRLSRAGATGALGRGVSLGPALLAARREVRRRKLTHFYERRLRRELRGLPLIRLPFLFREEIGPPEVRLLAGRLAQA